jgi:chromosome segregation ATPase
LSTFVKHTNPKLLDRRRLLKLAMASVLVVTGCTNVRQESDLDTAMNELDRQLDEITDDEQQLKLSSIAQRIQTAARELAAEHRTFTNSFESQLSSYDATKAQLEQLIEAYNRQRTSLRNELLHLQDELHAAMTPDQWAEVVKVLNRTGKSIAGYTLSES